MIGKIVTIDEKENWYLSEETEQNGTKYYLATKVDSNDEPEFVSQIFKEVKDGEDIYLKKVEDENELKYLSAIFITKYDQSLDELEDLEEA